MFTVIHGGAPLDDDFVDRVVQEAHEWVSAGGRRLIRVVEVWALPGRSFVLGCLAGAAVMGLPPAAWYLPGTERLVERLRSRGVAVRQRDARRSLLDDAELLATSQGWPVRYV